MKNVLCLLSLLPILLCFAQKEFQPKGSELIETVDGDLDRDKIPEKVMVYNTKDTNEGGNIREIQILKKINGAWTILEKSRHAILGKDEGGMMGDPYQSTVIQKNILIITHYGGSSWKWGVTDKYRFQNNHFELIGTSSEAGKPDAYWVTEDFNLATGKIAYNKVVNDKTDPDNGKSEKENFIKKGLKINLQNRNKVKIKLILPKTKAIINL